MNKANDRANEAQNAQFNSVKKGSKTAQAIALAVLTILGAEQAQPTIVYAGLAHAQQQADADLKQSQENLKVSTRKIEISSTIINIYKALMPLNSQSTQAQSLLTQMYQLQQELIAICTTRQKITETDKKIITGIDETFANAKFKPNSKLPNIIICDSKGCRI